MQTENSISHNISQLLQTICHTGSKLVNLAALEGRLAGISLMSILGLLLMASLLFFAAWLMLLIAGAIWLTSLNFNLITSLFIIGLLNLLLLIPVGVLIKHYFQKLFFPATRRQLQTSNIQTTEL